MISPRRGTEWLGKTFLSVCEAMSKEVLKIVGYECGKCDME
jgi:hypothetical protein